MGVVRSANNGIEDCHHPEEVRHASRNADSACPFLPLRQYKKGHTESAFRDACRTSSGHHQVLQINPQRSTHKPHPPTHLYALVVQGDAWLGRSGGTAEIPGSANGHSTQRHQGGRVRQEANQGRGLGHSRYYTILGSQTQKAPHLKVARMRSSRGKSPPLSWQGFP